MKTYILQRIAVLAFLPVVAGAQTANIRPLGSHLEVTWPARVTLDDRQLFPLFRVEASADLATWGPTGSPPRRSGSDAEPLLSMTLETSAPHRFFRLIPDFDALAAATATGGAEVFGFEPTFQRILAEQGQITRDEFAERYAGSARYLERISWDPTTAAHWDQFAVDPEVYNRGLFEGVDDLRKHDFRLGPSALARFKEQGFVVTERHSIESFADAFYALWEDDLPVFISADALLQAWHRSYDAMLEELEEVMLFSTIEQMLEAMAAQLPGVWAQVGGGVLRESLMDADYFLSVARSLLAGDPAPTWLGQDERVGETLAAIATESLGVLDLFGACRMVDFSQFVIRGHYENSERLGRYFQAMMWLGRVDLRVAGGPFKDCDVFRFASPREMGTAIVLWQLLVESGQFPAWLQCERVLETFVGWTDSMTFAQLGDLLTAAGIQSLADLPDRESLEALQRRLEAGTLGHQQIRGDYYVSPVGSEQLKLPRSFTVFGQKFVLDSWAMGKLVYDSILWTEDGVTRKVNRRVPSGLDIAFAVLGNHQVASDLVARMANAGARHSPDHQVRWRDGLPYHHHLAALHEVIQGQAADAWQQNLYLEWLATLRTLSVPTTDPQYPEALRTHAWAMKALNTQMASWAHLRHDTVLYSKPTYTAVGECYYPDGYVEPIPHFWERFQQMADRAAGALEALSLSGTVQVPRRFDRSWGMGGGSEAEPRALDLAEVRANQVHFLRRFAGTLGTLKRMADMQLAGQPFGIEEQLFIHNLIENVGFERAGCGGFRQYGGWYPQSFYRSVVHPESLFHQDYGADRYDAVVVDVHTNPPDPTVGDPGSVLHQGVGRALMLMIAIENGPDRMIYAGPVLSHYEFELVGPPQRMSNDEWKGWSWSADFPAPPEWTRSFLVPLNR